jgi:hypothetical protein
MALLVTIVAGSLMSERASAQNDPTAPGNPTVLAAVQEMQQTIVTLQNSVNALQASVDALGAPGQVDFRWTPSADAAGDGMECIVVNITDVEKTIQIGTQDSRRSERNRSDGQRGPWRKRQGHCRGALRAIPL